MRSPDKRGWVFITTPLFSLFPAKMTIRLQDKGAPAREVLRPSPANLTQNGRELARSMIFCSLRSKRWRIEQDRRLPGGLLPGSEPHD